MSIKKKKLGQLEIPDFSNIKLDTDILFNLFYPVGSLYLSYESKSPAELFGGEWTQITGRFLRAANDVNVGGADNVAITAAQLAVHSHSRQGFSSSYNSSYLATPQQFGYYSSAKTLYTGSTGSNSAHSNMPAYQDIYCWERTA